MRAILIEVEFEKIINKLEKVEVKIDEKREHIREVEMTSRMVKEPKRGIINTLPYYFRLD